MIAESSASSSPNAVKANNVWQFLLLGACTQPALAPSGSFAAEYRLPASPVKPASRPVASRLPAAPPKLTEIHRQLMFLCLRNPNWNNFRLVHHLRKFSPEITLETLQRLKQDCGLESREEVCNVLLRRLFSGCGAELSTAQLSFIHRIHPELHDRDIYSGHPGELLVYERLSGQQQEGLGRLYIHVFADMFNGWIFARISPRRTARAGLKILQDHIAPLYGNLGFTLQKVLHTSRETRDAREVTLLSSSQSPSLSEIQWEITHRQFGTLKHFCRHLAMNNFYEYQASGPSIFCLHAAFAKLLKEYNAVSDFNQRRPLLRTTGL